MHLRKFSSFSRTYAILYRQIKNRHTEERQEYSFVYLLHPAERHQNQNWLGDTSRVAAEIF
jgi:hypothetical protein